MPSDKPLRLRRVSIGGGPKPPEALVRAGVAHDRPPVNVVGGEAVSTTPGHGPSTAIAGNYKDTAEDARKVDRPSGEHTVFELHGK